MTKEALEETVAVPVVEKSDAPKIDSSEGVPEECPTDPAVVANKEPEIKRIPAKLLNIKGILDDRLERKRRAMSRKEKSFQKELDGLNRRMREAAEAVRDHIDDEYLRKGHDPEKVDLESRDKDDVIKHSRLATELSRIRAECEERAHEIREELDNSDEALALIDAMDRRSHWLAKFHDHYGSAEVNTDWDKGEIKLYFTGDKFPVSLLDIGDE